MKTSRLPKHSEPANPCRGFNKGLSNHRLLQPANIFLFIQTSVSIEKRHPPRGQGPNCCGFLRYNYMSERNRANIGTFGQQRNHCKTLQLQGKNKKVSCHGPWGRNSPAWFPGFAILPKMRSGRPVTRGIMGRSSAAECNGRGACSSLVQRG